MTGIKMLTSSNSHSWAADKERVSHGVEEVFFWSITVNAEAVAQQKKTHNIAIVFQNIWEVTKVLMGPWDWPGQGWVVFMHSQAKMPF